MDITNNITNILRRVSARETGASDDLLNVLYGELHRIAQAQAGNWRRGHTLSPTVVVNEAWLKIVPHLDMNWESRRHFLGFMSRAMRSVVIDSVRKAKAGKRSGKKLPIEFAADVEGTEPGWHVLDVDVALDRFAEFDPEGAKVVEMRFFGGFTNAQIAEFLDASERTVERYWRDSKAWLLLELNKQHSHEA